MFSKFDEDAQKILLMSKKEMLDLKHPYVGSEHLLLSILHNSKSDITDFLNNCGVTYDVYKEEIVKVIGMGTSINSWFLYTPLLKRIIENAILDSKEINSPVTVEKLFLSILEEGDGVANRILMGMNIDIDALYENFSSKFLYKNRSHKNKLLIEEFAVDFNKRAQNSDIDPVIGRDDKINRMIEILLRRTKNNPLLIGEAGVGKTALVEELARRIEKNLVPDSLKNKRILSLSMASIVAGTKYRGEFEERINKMIEEVEKSPDIILFIDEIHTIVGAGGAEGAIDASNILKPYLARGKIKLIGATTKTEYAKYLENDKALDRRFQKIYIEEATVSETENILLNLKEIYENYHGIKISDDIIKKIVELSDQYVSIGKQPDKAIDILDETCTKTLMKDTNYDKKVKNINMQLTEITEKKNIAIVDHDFKLASNLKNEELFLKNKLNKLELKGDFTNLKRDVKLDTLYDVIYERTKIPIKNIVSRDFNKIKKCLKKSVIGQDRAIDMIIDLSITGKKINKNNPNSFLLVGKSGVGKTFLVREYAKLLYPKEGFIKIDMSEYKDSSAISKIIGSNPGYVGYDDKNNILEKVKNNPYCVILLDEIEKAHSSVLKLFLQVLDDGYMTNSKGEKVDFSNSIIFMTSNLGCDKNSIGFISRRSDLIYEKIKSFLGIELINRIDNLIIFDDIKEKDIIKIIRNKINDFCICNGIENVDVSKYITKIKDKSNYNEFGARRVDKLISKEFQDMINV